MDDDEILNGAAIRAALRTCFPDATEEWLEQAMTNLLVYATAVTEILFRQDGIDPGSLLTDREAIPTMKSERRPPPQSTP